MFCYWIICQCITKNESSRIYIKWKIKTWEKKGTGLTLAQNCKSEFWNPFWSDDHNCVVCVSLTWVHFIRILSKWWHGNACLCMHVLSQYGWFLLCVCVCETSFFSCISSWLQVSPPLVISSDLTHKRTHTHRIKQKMEALKTWERAIPA